MYGDISSLSLARQGEHHYHTPHHTSLNAVASPRYYRPELSQPFSSPKVLTTLGPSTPSSFLSPHSHFNLNGNVLPYRGGGGAEAGGVGSSASRLQQQFQTAGRGASGGAGQTQYFTGGDGRASSPFVTAPHAAASSSTARIAQLLTAELYGDRGGFAGFSGADLQQYPNNNNVDARANLTGGLRSNNSYESPSRRTVYGDDAPTTADAAAGLAFVGIREKEAAATTSTPLPRYYKQTVYSTQKATERISSMPVASSFHQQRYDPSLPYTGGSVSPRRGHAYQTPHHSIDHSRFPLSASEASPHSPTSAFPLFGPITAPAPQLHNPTNLEYIIRTNRLAANGKLGDVHTGDTAAASPLSPSSSSHYGGPNPLLKHDGVPYESPFDNAGVSSSSPPLLLSQQPVQQKHFHSFGISSSSSTTPSSAFPLSPRYYAATAIVNPHARIDPRNPIPEVAFLKERVANLEGQLRYARGEKKFYNHKGEMMVSADAIFTTATYRRFMHMNLLRRFYRKWLLHFRVTRRANTIASRVGGGGSAVHQSHSTAAAAMTLPQHQHQQQQQDLQLRADSRSPPRSPRLLQTAAASPKTPLLNPNRGVYADTGVPAHVVNYVQPPLPHPHDDPHLTAIGVKGAVGALKKAGYIAKDAYELEEERALHEAIVQGGPSIASTEHLHRSGGVGGSVFNSSSSVTNANGFAAADSTTTFSTAAAAAPAHYDQHNNANSHNFSQSFQMSASSAEDARYVAAHTPRKPMSPRNVVSPFASMMSSSVSNGGGVGNAGGSTTGLANGLNVTNTSGMPNAFSSSSPPAAPRQQAAVVVHQQQQRVSASPPRQQQQAVATNVVGSSGSSVDLIDQATADEIRFYNEIEALHTQMRDLTVYTHDTHHFIREAVDYLEEDRFRIDGVDEAVQALAKRVGGIDEVIAGQRQLAYALRRWQEEALAQMELDRLEAQQAYEEEKKELERSGKSLEAAHNTLADEQRAHEVAKLQAQTEMYRKEEVMRARSAEVTLHSAGLVADNEQSIRHAIGLAEATEWTFMVQQHRNVLRDAEERAAAVQMELALKERRLREQASVAAAAVAAEQFKLEAMQKQQQEREAMLLLGMRTNFDDERRREAKRVTAQLLAHCQQSEALLRRVITNEAMESRETLKDYEQQARSILLVTLATTSAPSSSQSSPIRGGLGSGMNAGDEKISWRRRRR